MSEPKPLRIVSIGGGSGLSTLLRGLKRYARLADGGLDITAVVTVTDDGGSSGRLRREFDVLPPGDIRNCMVALSQDETLLSKLFEYRFSSGRGLKGHSFGNLFLTAMSHLTGDFGRAVKLCSEVLAVVGKIYPSTASNVVLEAILSDGMVVSGETRISRSTKPIDRVRLLPAGGKARKGWTAKPMKETLEAIAQADLITLGPGSLFTSVIPNLLVDGIPQAIAESQATTVYFMNLMSQPGETTGFLGSDHLAAVLRNCRPKDRELIDLCVANLGTLRSKAVRAYRAREARPVEIDRDAIEKMGIDVHLIDLVRMRARKTESADGIKRHKIRHDPAVLAAVAIELAQAARMGKSLAQAARSNKSLAQATRANRTLAKAVRTNKSRAEEPLLSPRKVKS